MVGIWKADNELRIIRVDLVAVLVSLAVRVAGRQGGSRGLIQEVTFYLKTWYCFFRFFGTLGVQQQPVIFVGVFRFSRTFARKVVQMNAIGRACSAASRP